MLRYAGLLLLAGLSSVQAETLFSTLPNGMKVLIKEDARAPVAVAVGAGVGVGEECGCGTRSAAWTSMRAKPA